MTTYRAVVKYPLDATHKERVKALVLGIEECAMELVGELEKDVTFIERVFEDVLLSTELEIQMREEREGGSNDAN